MTPRKPDRVLINTIAELRRLRDEDRMAILDLLEPASRLRVERLLSGGDIEPWAASYERGASFSNAGYSPWLLARLQGERDISAMTAASVNLLREIAQTECAVASASSQKNVPSGRRGRGLSLFRWSRSA